MHISREEFEKIVSEGKMFKLSDDMFAGTVEQFADSFFDNVDYDNVIEFAESMEVELIGEYTEEEHQKYLNGQVKHGH